MQSSSNAAKGKTRRVLRQPLVIALLAAVALMAGCLFLWQRWTAGLLRNAEGSLAAREYVKGQEQLARYLGVRSSDARARLLAARVARRLHQFDEATDQLRRCRQSGGPAEAIDTEYALIALQQGEEDSVSQLRQRALEQDELGLVILEALIQFDIDSHRLRLAQQDIDEYLRRRPDDLHARLGRGYVWEKLQSYADALEDYRQAVAAHPESERARLLLADTALIAGTPAEALEHYQWLAQRQGVAVSPEVQLGLARCQRRLGQTTEAETALTALLEKKPEFGSALWERGLIELENNRPAQAEPWLRKAAQSLPYDRRVGYSLYRCLLELGRQGEAETEKARVAQLDADLLRIGQLSQEVMSRPNDAALRCEGGLIFLRNGERGVGIRWLRMALRLDPNCEVARKALADLKRTAPLIERGKLQSGDFAEPLLTSKRM